MKPAPPIVLAGTAAALSDTYPWHGICRCRLSAPDLHANVSIPTRGLSEQAPQVPCPAAPAGPDRTLPSIRQPPNGLYGAAFPLRGWRAGRGGSGVQPADNPRLLPCLGVVRDAWEGAS